MTDVDEISTSTLDDHFDRTKKYFNKCGFDDATLLRRDIEMKDLQKTLNYVGIFVNLHQKPSKTVLLHQKNLNRSLKINAILEA